MFNISSLSLFHRLPSLLHMDRCTLIIWLPHGGAGAKNQLVLQKLQELHFAGSYLTPRV